MTKMFEWIQYVMHEKYEINESSTKVAQSDQVSLSASSIVSNFVQFKAVMM